MRVALLYPPVADATQPYSSLPALAAFLRERGNHEVLLHDASLEYALRMLTPERIAVASDDSHRKAPFVRDGVEGAIRALRSRETFTDLGRLTRARRIVEDAWEILGARDTDQFLETVTLPALQRAAPEAVGISITYRRQIAPAKTLAKLVRERLRIPVILGGQIASLWRGVLAQVPELFDWCDYLIAGEGETALDALLTALERGASLDDVPNLAYRRDGRLYMNRVHVEDIDALPTPDYRGLPLDRYLAPEPVLLLNTSRGCYWSRCAFCSVSPSMRGRFRMRHPDLVLNDIATLQERHGAQCIFLGDDSVPPRMLHALARGLRERRIDVSWQCEVRFEPQLDAALLAALRDAGCRNLIFGLESYAPRLLDAMNKGVRHAEILRILDDCRRTGVAFNLQLFFGFPGEIAEEARRTMDFVAGQLHGAATASFGTFRLQRASGVALHPQSFGVRIAEDQHPLSVELEYAPVPRHAEKMRRTLHAELQKRLRFSLSLGLDAHTLLYLHHAGVAAMGREHYAAPAAKPRGQRLERHAAQTLSGAILYDYELDRAVELSPLAVWVIEQLERPRSPRELARALARATGEPLASVLPAVNGITGALVERGLLERVIASRTRRRRPGSLHTADVARC